MFNRIYYIPYADTEFLLGMAELIIAHTGEMFILCSNILDVLTCTFRVLLTVHLILFEFKHFAFGTEEYSEGHSPKRYIHRSRSKVKFSTMPEITDLKLLTP